ncbi:MAG: HEAT repeat protein [Chlamydiales bacterium]|jgi:HEAT repeat protein
MVKQANGRCAGRRAVVRTLSLALLGVAVACARTDDRWTRDLDSPDPFVRAVAAIGLSVQSPVQAGPAVPHLLRAIDSAHVGLEREAAWALMNVGPLHVARLLEILVVDELMSDDRRGSIKNALVSAGPVAAGPIVACMRGRGSHMVGDLGEVLLAIGGSSVPDVLTMLVEERDVRLQSFAAFLLGRMGPAAQPAIPALQEAATSTDSELRQAANGAIANIQASQSGARGR